ncbi:MAG: hypothetical protein J3R72DRAFT_523382 [Linnemannia gamsii]|nr:MAG: hypothetical protein J3R72DRAFT_523382 [Linnemannia gamsii]
MTICETNSTQDALDGKQLRPNASSNFAVLSVKPTTTATADSDNNSLHPRPLRAKRKSVSNQGHEGNDKEIDNEASSSLSVSNRDQGDTMQDLSSPSWADRGTTNKQLRLTVESGRRLRSSLSSPSSSSPSSSCSPPSMPSPSISNSTSPIPASLGKTNHAVNRLPSPPSSHTPGSNGSLVEEMDLDTHTSSPSTASADMDVASLSDTLDLSILEEDSLVRQIWDLSSPPAPLPPLKDPCLAVSGSSMENQTQTHQQLLEDARAGKKVKRTKSRSTQPVLPAELLIKVFKFLAGYQSDLCSAALVSIEWNHWATGQLYRYPEFANTIHWAMFIQTLCKSKEDEVKRPPTTSRRYRPPIFTPACLSPHIGDHPPIQLAPGQMASFEAKLQQRRQDRLDRTLGEYVRGIDLSRKAIGASRFCSCGRPYGPPVSMNECSVCPRPGKSPSKAIGVFHISPRSTTGLSEQRATSPAGGSTGGSTGGEDEEEDEEEDDGFDDEEIDNLDSLTGRQNCLITASGVAYTTLSRPQRLGNCSGSLEGTGTTASRGMPVSHPNMSLLDWTDIYLPHVATNHPISMPRSSFPRASSTSTPSPTIPSPAIGSSNAVRTRRLVPIRDRNNALHGFRSGSPQLMNSGAAGGGISPGATMGSTVTVEKDTSSTRKPLTITVSSLVQMARHCPNLEWLCMVSAALADDTLYTRTGDYMSTLQPGPRTGLENVQVTVMDGIEALGKSCPYLGRVWLVGCDWVTHREVLALTSSCRQLQMLDARNCPRLEGRLSRLYVVMKRQEADYAGPALGPEKNREEDADAESDDIPNERVATPLEFETAPTTVLLGANVSGRGVRDGAMDDLFCWVYITAFVGMKGTSTTSTTTTTTPITTTSTTTTAQTSTLSPQAVNDILGMLSSVPLSREAPADPMAFQEWLKAIEGLDLVSYKPLKRLRSRFDIPCGLSGGGQMIGSASGGGASYSSSSNNNQHDTCTSEVNGNDNNDADNEEEEDKSRDGSEEDLADLDD